MAQDGPELQWNAGKQGMQQSLKLTALLGGSRVWVWTRAEGRQASETSTEPFLENFGKVKL